MAMIQTYMQLVDRVTPVLNTISGAITTTIGHFEILQRTIDRGINTGNFQTTAQDITNIGTTISQVEQLFEQARTTIERPIQPTIISPVIPPIPTINNPPPQVLPVPQAPPIPTWQSSNNIQTFNTSGLERFNQELASVQSMANRLASTQATISNQSNNARIFPQNMGNDMESVYQRVLRVSQAMDRLSQQRVGAADAGRLNSTLETLRGHLNNALSEQNALNAANSAYQRLVSNIGSAETHIRDNVNSQNSFNQSIRQGETNASNLMNKIKGCVGAYLGLTGIKKGIEETVGAAMQLNQQQQTLNTMFGNASVGDAYFKQLQKYALDTGQSMTNLTAATRRYIGYTKNTDKLMEFNKISQKMAVYDPIQGVQGAAYAINEALSGTYTSLKLRFEMSKADIEPLKKAVKGGNIDEVQAALNEIMAAKGVSDEVLESFQNTAAFKFDKLISTFKSKLAQAGEASIQVVEPMIDRVSTWLNSSGGSAMINGISTAAFNLMNIISMVATAVMNVGNFISSNWGIIAPIIGGIIGAMFAYNAILLITKSIEGGVAIVKGIMAAYALLHTGSTIAETAAQWGLNTALLACPITWVIVGIVAIVTAIAILVKHVGGVKVALLILQNFALTTWDNIKIWCFSMVVAVINGWNNMLIVIKGVTSGIQNALGNMKVNGLIIIQNFVNGAIDLINKLIEQINKIPNVSIEAISHVNFATTAQLENTAEQKAREAALVQYKTQKQVDNWLRERKLTAMRTQADLNVIHLIILSAS